MEISREDILKILDENKRLRKLIEDFKTYDEKRNEYYRKVQEDLEEYSARYLELKNLKDISGDGPIESKYKRLHDSYINLNHAYLRLKAKDNLVRNSAAVLKAEEILTRYDDLVAAQNMLREEERRLNYKKEISRLKVRISELMCMICSLNKQLEEYRKNQETPIAGDETMSITTK